MYIHTCIYINTYTFKHASGLVVEKGRYRFKKISYSMTVFAKRIRKHLSTIVFRSLLLISL